MNILTDAWIPVVVGGKRSHCSVSEVQSLSELSISTGRSDFDFAIKLLLIGLKNTDYVESLGDNPTRFLQRVSAKEGKLFPIGTLLLESPGANAIKHNTDFFVKRGGCAAMCTECAHIALYTQSQFAGAAGQGYYPARLFHNAIYLIIKDTVEKTVNANLTKEKQAINAYFSEACQYWLDDANSDIPCGICGSEKPTITHFYKKGLAERPDPVENPHLAQTISGRKYAITPTQTLIDIMDGAAFDSAVAIPPVSITENAKIGDDILCFSTFYDKASLKLVVHERFKLREAFPRKMLMQLSKATWQLKGRSNKPTEYDAGCVVDARKNMAARLLSGMDEGEAAFDVYQEMIPENTLSLSKQRRDAISSVMANYYATGEFFGKRTRSF